MEPSTPPDGRAADDPAGFDWLALDDDETVVWSDTPHRMALVPAMVVGLPLSLVLIGIPLVVGAYLSHSNTNYVVTTAALYRKTGVLSRSVQRIEFDKVQDTSYRQSFLGGQFGYGTVDVSTAGGTGVEMSFGNVEDPQALQRRINERIGSDRGDDADRDKAAVLDDILAELRAIRSAVETREDATDDHGHEPGGGVDTERPEGQGPEP
jgi:uncharacterized membrane protein YdbT with pleckstrin-like domain